MVVEGGNDGGGMMIGLGGNEMLNVVGSTIRNNFVDENNGRGGGVCLRVNEDSVNAFHFQIITFSSNVAFSGRNIFVWAHDLIVTAHQSRFEFMLGDGRDEVNGRGVVNLNESDHNLADLWVYRGSTIVVSGRGVDRSVCGSWMNPCLSVDVGVGKLEGENRHIILVGGEGEVRLGGRIGVSGVVVQSTEGFKCVVVVEVEGGEFNDGDEDELILNEGVFEMRNISLVLKKLIGCGVMIESNGSELVLLGVDFSQTEISTRLGGLSVVRVRSGLVEMVSVCVSGMGFDSAVFVIEREVWHVTVVGLECAFLSLGNHTIFSFSTLASPSTSPRDDELFVHQQLVTSCQGECFVIQNHLTAQHLHNHIFWIYSQCFHHPHMS